MSEAKKSKAEKKKPTKAAPAVQKMVDEDEAQSSLNEAKLDYAINLIHIVGDQLLKITDADLKDIWDAVDTAQRKLGKAKKLIKDIGDGSESD